MFKIAQPRFCEADHAQKHDFYDLGRVGKARAFLTVVSSNTTLPKNGKIQYNHWKFGWS